MSLRLPDKTALRVGESAELARFFKHRFGDSPPAAGAPSEGDLEKRGRNLEQADEIAGQCGRISRALSPEPSIWGFPKSTSVP